MFEKSKLENSLIIYHKNCTDGFMSAFVFWKIFTAHFGIGALGSKFVALQYGDPVPDVTDKNVFILDFSFKPEVLKNEFKTARSVVTLDHHATSYMDYATDQLGTKADENSFFGQKLFRIPNVCCNGSESIVMFKKEHSGAGMTLEYLDKVLGLVTSTVRAFAWYTRLTDLVKSVEDRDLWKFKYPNTKAIHEVLNSEKSGNFSFEYWDSLLYLTDAEFKEKVSIGNALVDMRYNLASALASKAEPVFIFGKEGVMINGPSFLTSEIGSILSQDHAFALIYQINSDTAIMSFRSKEGTGEDVSQFAKRLGGGGHVNAAAAHVTLDTFISLIKTRRLSYLEQY